MAWLHARVAELEAENSRLRQAAEARDEAAAAQLAAERARADALAARVEELERRMARDSSTSSRSPSSDSPYQKKPKDRSLRGRSGRRPGKQPGAQSSTLKQSSDPDETVFCGPATCGCCGHDLAGEPALTVQKLQVFEASPPPPPTVTEYQIQAKQCPGCGEVSVGLAPAGVTGRVQYGPRAHASAALAVCANYLPVARAARLVAALTGVQVSAGFVAGIRGKAAARLGPFMERVRELLHAAPVLYADETPARTAGKLRYVHVACTEFLTAMHTGDRTKEAIDAGGVLPGYAGTIVRDGYKGYEHLTDALHAWCGAHGLRDLAGLYRFDPDGQIWARSMADVLIDANAAATAARAAGRASLDDAQLARIRSWYRGAVAKGITGNQGKRTQIGKDGLTLARRFRDHEDMILRFATDLAVGFTSTRPNGTSARSRSSSGPPADAGAPWPAWPTSRSCSPTCPPPNGASMHSPPSPGCSPAAPGSRQRPHLPDRSQCTVMALPGGFPAQPHRPGTPGRNRRSPELPCNRGDPAMPALVAQRASAHARC